MHPKQNNTQTQSVTFWFCLFWIESTSEELIKKDYNEFPGKYSWGRGEVETVGTE